MTKLSKMILIGLLFIIAFFIGFFIAKGVTYKNYKDQNIEVNVSCRTKDNQSIKIIANVNYDNNLKKSEYFIKKAIKESCMYMFHLYTLDEVHINKYEIEALTTEDIFNRLQIQNKGFMIYKFEYTLKE